MFTTVEAYRGLYCKALLALIHGGGGTNGDEFYVLLSFNFCDEYCDSEEAEFNYVGHCDFIFLSINVALLLLRTWLDRNISITVVLNHPCLLALCRYLETPKIAPLFFIALTD